MISLSQEQAAAAAALQGPVRVVAGAGTGKTAVIAERYRQLLESGVPSGSILVMTFSERAANEMRARIAAACGLDLPPHVGTFHSMAMRWLREAGERSGVPQGFDILTGPERWILMRELMWELGDPALVGSERPDDNVRPLLALQERLKQELVPLSKVEAWCAASGDVERRDYLGAAARLFKEHARRLRRSGLLDFDDLLLHTVRMLESQADLRAAFGRRFPWIMVDEYQDTNLAQERIVELLAGAGAGQVCVVGDDDQSIYRFRGASRASMERFLRSFPTAQTWTLGRNLRSSGNIVEAARALIDHSPDRLSKPLSALAAPGAPVRLLACADGGAEALAIAAEAARLESEGMALSAIAVLTRTHAIARPIGEAFDQAGLRWQQRGGQGLYQRPEIRDLIATLRLANDPEDRLALARLVCRAPLDLDLSRVLARVAAAADSGRSPLVALSDWAPTRRWAALMLDLVALKATLGVDELLFEYLDRSRFLDTATASSRTSAESERVVANVSRFVELVAAYCERRVDHSLRLFSEHLDLVLLSGVEEEVAVADAPGDAIQVMSIHQAKGLEFEAVFIPGLVEGRLPQPRRRDGEELPAQLLEPAVRGREDHLAEERRLCYVAMTRARRQLWLSWAQRYEGDKQWRPSRFLDEIQEPGAGPAATLESARAEAADARPPVPGSIAGRPAARRVRAGAEGQAEADAGLVLSYSAISTYRECPRQYRYRYQLGLPAAVRVEAQFGNLLHVVLMRAGRMAREGREVTGQALEALQRAAWAEVELADPRRRPVLEALGRRLLETYREAGGLSQAPHLIEKPFSTKLDSWTLRGIIDRVDPPPTQEGRGVGSPPLPWRIVDYKSGTPVPPSRLRRDLQLALYALGARDALGLDPVELEIVYLRGAKRVQVPAEPELLEEARRVGGEVASAIRRGEFEPRPERRRCQLCPYRLPCEAAF